MESTTNKTHPKLVDGGEDQKQFEQQEEEMEEEEGFAYAIQLVTSTVLSMAMQTVTELGVFDIIAKAGSGAMLSAKDIATQLCSKNPEAANMLDRVLRVLASHSVLYCSVVEDDSNQKPGSFKRLYSLAPVAKFFACNHDGVSLGPLLSVTQDKVYLDSWPQLKEAILEGGITFNRVHVTHAFDYPSSDSRFLQLFHTAMTHHTTLVMKKILESYKGFDEIDTLVNVGGGLGVTLNLITSKYPNIKGINFDLPHVIQQAPSYPGVEHVGADMFENVPKGDVIFMKWILHDWSDESCLKLLKNCYDAIPEDGKVIVVEELLPMSQNPGGKERSEAEFMELATTAGFGGIRYECSWNYWVMEFFK